MPNRPGGKSTKKMIERINQTIVSKEEIIKVVRDLELSDPNDRDWEGLLFTIIRLNNGNAEKGKAIMFRFEALARLLESDDNTGWTIKLPNGAISTQEPVFAAAAVEKLIEINGEVGFNRESFLSKVLELADLDIVG